MTELGAGLSDAIAGHSHLFLLSGEPGIGKTRLADEFGRLAVAWGARVAWGTDSSRPFDAGQTASHKTASPPGWEASSSRLGLEHPPELHAQRIHFADNLVAMRRIVRHIRFGRGLEVDARQVAPLHGKFAQGIE